MDGIEITALKKEYQQMVLNKQDKYNPDYNSILDDYEINILKNATRVKTIEELLANNDKDDLARRMANGIHVKKVVKDGHLDGTYSGGSVGVGAGSGGGGVYVGGESGTINGDISRTIEMDFYEGQHYTDIHETVFKNCFKDLDLDGNGKLSANEISAYKEYAKLKNHSDNLHSQLYDSQERICKGTTISLGSGLIGGLVTGLVTKLSLNQLVNKLTMNGAQQIWVRNISKEVITAKDRLYDFLYDFDYFSHGANSSGASCIVALGALAGAAAVGIGVLKLFSIKKEKEESSQLQESINEVDMQLSKFGNRYSNMDS